MSEVAPKINRRLKMFDPIRLPAAISGCPWRAATIDAESSGKLVPKAAADKPTTAEETPSATAMSTDACTSHSLPMTSKPTLIVATKLLMMMCSLSRGTDVDSKGSM